MLRDFEVDTVYANPLAENLTDFALAIYF